MNKNMKGW